MMFNYIGKKQSLLVFLILFLNALQEALCALNWDTFEGCKIEKTCNYKTEQEMLIAYAKGLPNRGHEEDNFQICHELDSICGYVAKSAKNKTFSMSGVRIGRGVDLGHLTLKDLNDLRLKDELIAKLSPYLGLKGEEALEKLKAYKNLTFKDFEVGEISREMEYFRSNNLEKLYQKLKKPKNATERFQDLHLSIRTAVFSLYSNRPLFEHVGFLEALAANNWAQAANLVEAFKGSPSRRKSEALLLRSVDVKWQNEMYVSLVMNQKGGLSYYLIQMLSKFIGTKKIFVSMISAGDAENSVKVHCNFTSNYKDWDKAFEYISNNKTGNNFAGAIEQARNLFLSTESYQKGNLHGRIMVVITNSKTSDTAEAVAQAEITRKSGIPIISVGVSKEADETELINISGGNKNVINNFRMEEMWDQVGAAVATQPFSINSNRTLSGSLMNSTTYLQIEKSKNSNIKFNVKQTLNNNTIGESKIIICASYNDPYPSEFSKDLCHYGNNKGEKELVMDSMEKALERDNAFSDFEADYNFRNMKSMEGNEKKSLRVLSNQPNDSINKRNLLLKADGGKEILYLSIKGSEANFTIKAEECDPKNCQFGTNESGSGNILLIVLIIILGIVFILGGLFVLWKYIGNKRREEPKSFLMN